MAKLHAKGYSRPPHPKFAATLMLEAVWSILTFPFRVLAWVVTMLGRLAALILGFTFMVIGVALFAGTLYVLGVPLFIVGLLLTLRALG